jgi:uncharacterized protein
MSFMKVKFSDKILRAVRGQNYIGIVPQLEAVCDIVLSGDNLGKMLACKQHKNCNCLQHSIAVAYFSLLVVTRFKIKCSRSRLLRCALLHDYHLGDWREDNGSSFRHGFMHAKVALQNANSEFALDLVEQNAILRHMFPMNPIPPKYIEGVIVCIVDKACAVYEATSRNPYRRLKTRIDRMTPDR